MIENINWYPGHMKKTRELIAENLKACELCLELVDARIPVSSRNPVIGELLKDKPRIVILNKADLADEAETARWIERIVPSAQGLSDDGDSEGGEHGTGEGAVVKALPLNANTGSGVKELFSVLKNYEESVNLERARKRPLRLMIVGVPNVGKSSLINRLTGRRAAQVGDRPGVTKGKQWLAMQNGMQLLDTPGILWPKFEDPKVGLNLAFCGSIKDEILPLQELGLELIALLGREYPDLLAKRYKLTATPDIEEAGFGGEEGISPALALMEEIAKKRGFLLPGKRIDYERTAHTVLDEFRSGAIGRISLEKAASAP